MKPIIQKIAMLAAMLSVFIHASAYDFVVDGLCYSIKNTNEVDITCTNSKDIPLYSEIKIPSVVEYNNKKYTVTAINQHAFEGCDDLISVEIPNTVKNIGAYAFNGCSSLTKIEIPNTVIGMGAYLFKNCSNLTKVVMPDSIKRIGQYTFSGCSSLIEVEIPNSVEDIRSHAFENCIMLTNVEIPNSVEMIGRSAFWGCYNLFSVLIPAGVKSIGEKAFPANIKEAIWLCDTPPNGASNLDAEINYTLSNKFSFGIDKTIVYPYLTSLFEVDDVIYVPTSLSDLTCDVIDCNYNSNHKDIVIGAKVNNIDGVQFSVQNINNYSFYHNYTITSLNLQNNGNIGISAFELCQNLETAIIDNVGKIGDHAFVCCDFSKSLTIGNNVTEIGYSAFNGYMIDNRTQLYYHSLLSEVIIPDNIKSIGEWAFSNNHLLKSVKIGNGLNELSESSFENCKSLENIIIPSNVQNIENNVFKGCKSLKNVTFEELIIDGNSISSEISLGCNGFKSPLFADCPLENIFIGRKLSYSTEYRDGYSPFFGNKFLRSVKFSDAENRIYKNEFRYCTNLESVECGDGITIIGKSAFSGCSSMKSCVLGSKLESIYEQAFSDCFALTNLKSNAIEPPICENEALNGIIKEKCTLYVPEESIEKYKVADQWKDFFNIESGIDDITADGGNGLDFSKSASGITINNAADARVEVYGLDGRLCRAIPAYAGEEIALNRGVYIVRVNGKSLKIAI